jgi:hypothetical protein
VTLLAATLAATTAESSPKRRNGGLRGNSVR